jgi:hypothetical protein
MTESDLVAALQPVADAFEALGVRCYLTGSVASSAHGIARASLDADIVAALEPAHADPVVSRLASAYHIPVDRLHSAVAARSSRIARQYTAGERAMRRPWTRKSPPYMPE